MSMKEIMSQPKSNQAQLKDDLKSFPLEAVQKYEFFLKLFKIFKETGKKVMVNDASKVELVYTQQIN